MHLRTPTLTSGAAAGGRPPHTSSGPTSRPSSSQPMGSRACGRPGPGRAHAHSPRVPGTLRDPFPSLSFLGRAAPRTLPTRFSPRSTSQGRTRRRSGPGRGGTRMWSRSRPAGTRWRGGARRRARGLREAGPGARAPAARRSLAPLPTAEPAPGRRGPSERLGAAEGRQLAWPPAALAAAPGRASPGPPRSRPGESEVCWRPSL